MNWYHAAGGAPQGPISEEQLRALAQQGVVTAATLVWREGMPGWQAYGGLFGDGAPPAGRLPPVVGAPAGRTLRDGEHVCVECGKTMGENDMLRYGDRWVCAACKPVFLQRLQEGADLSGMSAWRMGKQLVMLKRSVLPSRCVKCNLPTESTLQRKLYWFHPALWLVLFVGCAVGLSFLPFLITVLIVRKRADITIGVCERHLARRRMAIWVSSLVSVLALGVAGFGGFMAIDSIVVSDTAMAMLILGGFVTLLAMLFGSAFARLVAAKRMDAERVWVGGVCKEYLAELPEWTGN